MRNFKMRLVRKMYADYKKEAQKEDEAVKTIFELKEKAESCETEEEREGIYEKQREAYEEEERARQRVYVLAKLIVEELPESIFTEEESHEV